MVRRVCEFVSAVGGLARPRLRSGMQLAWFGVRGRPVRGAGRDPHLALTLKFNLSGLRAGSGAKEGRPGGRGGTGWVCPNGV